MAHGSRDVWHVDPHPSAPLDNRTDDAQVRQRGLIIALRVFGVLTAITGVAVVSRAMNALPWVVDGLLALAAAAAFSFWFDREDRH